MTVCRSSSRQKSMPAAQWTSRTRWNAAIPGRADADVADIASREQAGK